MSDKKELGSVLLDIQPRIVLADVVETIVKSGHGKDVILAVLDLTIKKLDDDRLERSWKSSADPTVYTLEKRVKQMREARQLVEKCL